MVIIVALIDSEDKSYQKICDQRMECFNSCDKTFFPSLLCNNIENVSITLHGNTYNNFFKYPDPSYVLTHEESKVEVPNSNSETEQNN